jgi:hypothetical protein
MSRAFSARFFWGAYPGRRRLRRLCPGLVCHAPCGAWLRSSSCCTGPTLQPLSRANSCRARSAGRAVCSPSLVSSRRRVNGQTTRLRLDASLTS